MPVAVRSLVPVTAALVSEAVHMLGVGFEVVVKFVRLEVRWATNIE